jgi:adenosylcobyric acid synthase
MDCGGVFAQVVGTRMCVPEKDWEMCVGVIINKLRGEEEHFEPGPTILERMVGKPVFIVPFLDNLHLPEEDGLGLEQRLSWEKHGNQRSENKENKPVVVVVAYPYTSIADDLFPLEQDERFHVEWRRKRIPKPYPSTTAVILPGSRRTMIDLKWLFDSGWANFIRRHRSAGGVVLGLCGGYQMLGRNVADPDGTEGIAEMRQGIGLFPISTTIAPPQCKVVTRRNAQLYPSGIHVEGFELHCGVLQVLPEQVQSIGRACGISPLLAFEDGRPEGMRLGSVKGTYLHGILRSAKARVELLVANPKFFPSLKNAETVEEPLDRLANHLESCGLDCNVLNSMIFGRREDHDRDYGKEEKSDESTKKHAEKQQKVGLRAPPSPPRL